MSRSPHHTTENPFTATARRSSPPTTSDRLERGQIVEWKGPSLDQTVLPVSYPGNRKARRPKHKTLLSKRGPARSSAEWSLEITDEIGTYFGNSSPQMLRCEAFRRSETGSQKDRTRLSVVLKLSLKAIAWRDPTPEISVNPGDRASHYRQLLDRCKMSRTKREVLVYRALNNWQGDKISYCYGVYNFTIGRREFVGFVLENLGPSFSPLGDVLKQEIEQKTLTSKKLDQMMTAAYETHNLFVRYGIFHYCDTLDIYLCSQENDQFRPVVAVGFGTIQTKKERENKMEVQNYRPNSRIKKELESWCSVADWVLGQNFSKLFEQEDRIWENSKVAKEWEKTETVQTRGRQR